MFITQKHLPRRTFLRGALGAMVAMPFLDAMIPALAPMWTPPMSGFPSGAFMPLIVTRWLRYGSSGDMIGLNSNLLPVVSGCHICG